MKGFVAKAVSTIPRGPVLLNSLQKGTLLKATAEAKRSIPKLAPNNTKLGENVLGAWSRAPYNITNEKMLRQESKVTLAAEMMFPRKITWLAGAPGAGKGTNSVYVANTLGYTAPTIVMSSLLESPECKRIKDAGGMVDDEVVCKVLLEELAKPQYRQGVVVDGFPRTEKQAAWLKSLHKTLSADNSDAAPKFNFVMLHVGEEASIARQLSRGDVVRKQNAERAKSGLNLLELRATDTCANAARIRYRNFIDQYSAVAKHAAAFPFSVVDASATVEVVQQRLQSSLVQQQNNNVQLLPTSSAYIPAQLDMPVSRMMYEYM